jgi:hypothetical protein
MAMIWTVTIEAPGSEFHKLKPYLDKIKKTARDFGAEMKVTTKRSVAEGSWPEIKGAIAVGKKKGSNGPKV